MCTLEEACQGHRDRTENAFRSRVVWSLHRIHPRSSRLDCFLTRNFFLLYPDRKPAGRLRGQCGTSEIKAGRKEQRGILLYGWLDETRTRRGIDMSVVQFQFGIPDQYRRSCKPKLISLFKWPNEEGQGTRGFSKISRLVSSGNPSLILHKCDCLESPSCDKNR